MSNTIAVTGVGGRMGKRLVALSTNHGLKVEQALCRAGSPAEGKDAGELAGLGKIGVTSSSQLSPNWTGVLIDFSSPEGMRHWIKDCRARKISMVIGTTGLSAADQTLIDDAAKDIAVLQAPNMSLGVNLLFKVAAEVAKILGDDYDIEIVESHHRLKKEAPSGTAAGLADAILKSTGKTKDRLVYGRHGEDVLRQRGDIGVHSLRLGDEAGKHTATFATMGEYLELSHTATTRDTFAHGALKAAKWIAGKPAGRYAMRDVLGL